jgi:hypothetical protein
LERHLLGWKLILPDVQPAKATALGTCAQMQRATVMVVWLQ